MPLDFKKFWENFTYRLKESGNWVLLLFSIVVGVCGGFGAVIFRWLIFQFKTIFFDKGQILSLYFGRYYLCILPAIGGLIVGILVFKFAKEAKGHGVPEVMDAVVRLGGRIRPRVTLVKSLASAICIGSGGSAGREGPIVQIGSAIASTIGQIFRLPSKRLKNLVACGAAAGIAATFNAPIAGVFFALEIILGHFSATSFSTIVLSSVTATIISRIFLGNTPAFKIPQYAFTHPIEILFYIVLGFFAVLTSISFIKCLYATENLFERLKIPPYLKPMLGGLIVGIIGIFVPQIFGVGYESIEKVLTGKFLLISLISLFFLKIFSTSLTIGSGGSGGVFAPSLFIGSMLGGFIGFLFKHFFPSFTSPYGAYALVGMAAVFAGVSHAPITAIIIIFEMTGDYKIILPLMTACSISTVFSKLILKNKNIYTIKLLKKGITLRRGFVLDTLKSIKVADVMDKVFPTIYYKATVEDAVNKFTFSTIDSLPVLTKDKKLIGMLTVDCIRDVPVEKRKETLVKDVKIKKKYLVKCFADETLYEALKKFGVGIERIPVVEKKRPNKIVGMLTRKDIVDVYNKLIAISEREATLEE